MVWLTVVLFIFILSAYLFFAPFYLEIDSEQQLLRVRFHHLASARLLPKNALVIEMNIAGWKRQIDLLAVRSSKDKSVKKKPAKRRRIAFSKLRAIVRSFKVNKCSLIMDTGNRQANGLFFPVFLGISNLTGKLFQINFSGETELVLVIENNMARLLWAFIRH